ncbi:MAG TPA: hypothetical protein VMZ30_11130 [Pyrinomonadaceae bacterium]|nr:hypothetical protein [Pyrinomonadaceae bacterium]
MKLKSVAVWGFFFAGVLYVIGGLRDIFAPGFFNISPHVPSKGDIAMQFLLAAMFLAMAALTNKTKNQVRANKK